ncbi:DCC1-like thiol-disulfide oxidoreductase family protein [Methylobacter sp.]|uniref:DCC1-like thiol-disulfide oxidoreductase family protein n=1 Tax=Methylobacter sp. TaxID=2051955 RepID=UPI002488F248|nr:DCC1-like thiol-disulfide oxidoreductase family protein [Methylobacter sp.]MDI1277251.1 DCC1-like thiol-disulfide oxidoreductase family protein [Methylobacter sp.]MDI1357817.1 DCC1-like thiol-disulfide oxidoreductase family protein [Methylobacter sp.]
MYKLISSKILELHSKQAPATGIGLFRILYGLITLQEIIFLLYFNHLIFDPIPYIDVEFPMIPFFLCLWGVIAAFIVVGYRYQFAMTCNYIIWIIFVNFTPMQRDFDGGFDLFMIGAGFFLLFMPGDRAFSIDNLRYKLSTPFTHYSAYPKPTVSTLAYTLPVAICLGFLYFDSAIHKIFAEHWRNGLGTWLPATQPYYVSAIDMSSLLNNTLLQNILGYTILIFQFTFIFFFTQRRLRIIYLLVGLGLHLGITLSFNIYPFGLGMLSFYTLLVPFKGWHCIGRLVTAKQPSLTVFYDQLCPLCNRTVLILNHFDLFSCIDFKSAQEHAAHYPALASINNETLLTDLYALDRANRIYSGVDTYAQIFIKMRYLFPIGIILNLPGIHQFALKKYRSIADTRNRIPCSSACPTPQVLLDTTLYHQFFEGVAAQKPQAFSRKLSKILLALLVLQLNSSVHYGLIYRLNADNHQNPISQASNAVLMISQTFLGITPHALYLHDHFAGYDHILAITYTDQNGTERWLPFVNEQGRLLAPNWGRVHSMWANIAVTPNIDNKRLHKFIMKVTAFWGQKIGLSLDNVVFNIKLKKISAPSYWVEDQLHKNFTSPWTTIGTAKWTDNRISFDLPDNINEL